MPDTPSKKSHKGHCQGRHLGGAGDLRKMVKSEIYWPLAPRFVKNLRKVEKHEGFRQICG